MSSVIKLKLDIHSRIRIYHRQAQVTGGGLALQEVDEHFQFKGCPGLYFVGETLDCTGSCGGFNLHWAFGSGIVAGQSAARQRPAKPAFPGKKKK